MRQKKKKENRTGQVAWGWWAETSLPYAEAPFSYSNEMARSIWTMQRGKRFNPFSFSSQRHPRLPYLVMSLPSLPVTERAKTKKY